MSEVERRSVVGSLPVTWSVGTTGEQVAKSRAQIYAPTKADVEAVESRRNVCGECAYFDLEEGQRRIRETRFLERLERENGWRIEYLGSPPQQLGLCRAWSGSERAGEGETVTGVFHKACDGFRPANGLTRLRTRRVGE